VLIVPSKVQATEVVSVSAPTATTTTTTSTSTTTVKPTTTTTTVPPVNATFTISDALTTEPANNTVDMISTMTLKIAVKADAVVEPTETMMVQLYEPKNATIARGAGVGTIFNRAL